MSDSTNSNSIMKIRNFAVLLMISCLACNNDKEAEAEEVKVKADTEMVFDKVKWNIKDGESYL